MDSNTPFDDGNITLCPKVPTGFDPHSSLRHLADYIKWLEAEYTTLKRKYSLEIHHLANRRRDLETENKNISQEMERLKHDLMGLIKVLEERDSSLAIEIQKNENMDKIVRRQTKDVSTLENKLTIKIKQYEMMKNDYDRNTLDLNRLLAEHQRLENKVVEQEKLGDIDRTTAHSAERDARRLNLELAELHGKFALTENKLEEKKLKHDNEIKKWQQRLEYDVQHERESMKKRLSSNLQQDLKEAEDLSLKKASAETCSDYRFLFNRIVAKLNQAGIKLI